MCLLHIRPAPIAASAQTITRHRADKKTKPRVSDALAWHTNALFALCEKKGSRVRHHQNQHPRLKGVSFRKHSQQMSAGQVNLQYAMLISSVAYTHSMTKVAVQLFVRMFGPDRSSDADFMPFEGLQSVSDGGVTIDRRSFRKRTSSV